MVRMKILVCGKGGCGKSTLTTLLAKEIARRGNRVLVLDTDESNFGLHRLLGADRPKDFMEFFGGKKVLFERVQHLREKWTIDDIPKEYLAERGNVKLIPMGKIYKFGEGCACPINALSSRFLEVLELRENEFLIADTDAGVEHFGRGVEKGCDIMLVVVDPTQESVHLAKRVSEMAREINKDVYYVLNKVDEETEEFLSGRLDKSKILAAVPASERIFKSSLKGEEMDFEMDEIKELVDFLEKLESQHKVSRGD